MAIAVVGILSLALVAGEQEAERVPAKAGQLIRFEVLIADLTEAVEAPSAEKVLELEKAGKLQARVRFQLASLEEMPASIQFAESVPRLSGYAGAGRLAQPLPIYRDASVGTNLRVTARVSEDKTIVTQFFLERTALAGEAEKPAGADAVVAPPAIHRMQSNTTLKLKTGEPQVIGAQQMGGGNEANRTWIVITAHVGN